MDTLRIDKLNTKTDLDKSVVIILSVQQIKSPFSASLTEVKYQIAFNGHQRYPHGNVKGYILLYKNTANNLVNNLNYMANIGKLLLLSLLLLLFVVAVETCF